MGFDYAGIVGLIILALDLWAIVSIVQGRGPMNTKLLWIIIILILPVIGLILWLLVGQK